MASQSWLLRTVFWGRTGKFDISGKISLIYYIGKKNVFGLWGGRWVILLYVKTYKTTLNRFKDPTCLSEL